MSENKNTPYYYNNYSTYLKNLFHERVQKLSIDGGFTCPNRDGSISSGGCTFCNNDSFTPQYCRKTEGIYNQINEGIKFFDHKYKTKKYLAYFQSYSNTYATLDVLKRKYEEALSHPKIYGLIIGTRPDIVSNELLNYLEDLASTFYINIEYGVESTNDNILKSINRGHTYETSIDAIKRTANRNIIIGAHLIFGLPGEDQESTLKGALELCKLPINVLKLHQLQIINGTKMAEQYQENPSAFKLYTADDYLEFIAKLISHMPLDIYLERFVNQSPAEYLIAPKWHLKNYEFTNKLENILEQRGITQGCKFNPRG